MKLLAIVFVAVILCGPYVWNAYKLSGCDFESPYRCEVAHGIGVLIPPSAYVTVWFDGDRKGD